MAIGRLPHLVLTEPPQTTIFTSTGSGGDGKPSPSRDRRTHGQYLRSQFDGAWQAAEQEPTAEMLTKQLPEVDVKTLMAVSAVTDAGSLGEDAHFTSRNEDRISSVRVPLLTSADIVSLPIGQAFCLLNGSHLYKIRIPLASKKDDEVLPNDLTQMLTTMHDHYHPGYDWQSWHQQRGG